MPFARILVTLAALVFIHSDAVADRLLDANAASEAEIAALDGLADGTARLILEGRPYATIRDLDTALRETLGDDELETLYGKLFVPIKLNTASREDILLIPGVGRKMAHEFEEYRPYSSIEQFRREIGKYVDDEEVARLEMYVTLD